MDSTGVENQWNGVQFTCLGLDSCSSIEGHLKPPMFSIEIYAAIDMYSHYITWFACRISGKTGVSIPSKFLFHIYTWNWATISYPRAKTVLQTAVTSAERRSAAIARAGWTDPGLDWTSGNLVLLNTVVRFIWRRFHQYAGESPGFPPWHLG